MFSRKPLIRELPQGAVLSPMLFNICMLPHVQLEQNFGLGCHQYAHADNAQVYLLLDGHLDTTLADPAADSEAMAG